MSGIQNGNDAMMFDDPFVGVPDDVVDAALQQPTAIADAVAQQRRRVSKVPEEVRVRLGFASHHMSYIVARMQNNMENMCGLLDKSNELWKALETSKKWSEDILVQSSDNMFIDAEKLFQLIINDAQAILDITGGPKEAAAS